MAAGRQTGRSAWLFKDFVMAKSAADKAKGTEHPDYHFIKVVMTD